MHALLDENRDEILRLATEYGASDVRVFGSIARGDATQESDIDFLVKLAPGRTLLDLGGLWYDLRELLGRDIDVISEAGLRERVRGRVLSEARPL